MHDMLTEVTSENHHRHWRYCLSPFFDFFFLLKVINSPYLFLCFKAALNINFWFSWHFTLYYSIWKQEHGFLSRDQNSILIDSSQLHVFSSLSRQEVKVSEAKELGRESKGRPWVRGLEQCCSRKGDRILTPTASSVPPVHSLFSPHFANCCTF